MGILGMKPMRKVPGSAVVIAFSAFAACSSPDPNSAVAAKNKNYYAVVAPQAPFYRYGPQQSSGPDKKLTRNTLLSVISASFGYCRVQLMTGEEGYIAAEDIHPASAELVSAATAPPARQYSDQRKFRLNSVDPRLIAPPEPLPLDLPEPTPIPATQSSPH